MYNGGFQLNNPYFQRSSRYRRRGKSGPTAAAIDFTVTPAFPGLSAPAAPTLTASTTGGSLAAGTQTYAVTAYNVNGETLASAAANVTTTGTTSSVSIALATVTGATGYRIYKQVGGSLYLLADAGATTPYIDTGAVTPSAATPAPTVNSTQTIAGAVAGQINAGDSVYRTANGVAALYNPAANSATYVGESEDSYPQASGYDQSILIGRPTYDTKAQPIAIRTSGEFAKKTTPGETLAPGVLVYCGADPQTVTIVATGTAIGRVCNDQNPVGGGYSTPITGAAGVEVMIEIAPAVSP